MVKPPYKLRCTICGHIWYSEWEYHMFGWKFECSKCGAKNRMIVLA